MYGLCLVVCERPDDQRIYQEEKPECSYDEKPRRSRKTQTVHKKEKICIKMPCLCIFLVVMITRVSQEVDRLVL